MSVFRLDYDLARSPNAQGPSVVALTAAGPVDLTQDCSTQGELSAAIDDLVAQLNDIRRKGPVIFAKIEGAREAKIVAAKD